MMIEGLPGSQQPVDPSIIENFLDEFNQKCVEFGYYCDQYMRQEIGIDDITRHLSTATAEAEASFVQHSFNMNMDQLQRYGVIQKTLDNMTVQLFDTEIQRSRDTINAALKNGEYFIVRITYNAIQSSIYMKYSKNKIKTDQEQALKDLETEQEATNTIVKVLKAIESAVRVDTYEDLSFEKIQKALDIYVNYFKNSQIATKPACDARLFVIVDEHAEFLKAHEFGGDAMTAGMHLSLCSDTLQPLAKTPEQEALLSKWRTLTT